MKKHNPKEVIDSLKIRLKHLKNDYLLTREEYENTTRKYLDILSELKERNKQLVHLQSNLEEIVARRTEQLQETKKILLQKSEELEAIIDSSPSLIFYKDKNNRYVRVNKSFASTLGIPLRKIIGKTDQELFGEKKERFLGDNMKVIRTGIPVLNKEEILKTKRGRRLLLIDRIPFRNVDGKIVGIIGFAMDITELKMLEEEQSKAARLESLGLLAGGIAHDFNNILTSILGNISLARMFYLKDGKIAELLKDVEKASLRARDLTQQLLTFSKGGAPRKISTSIIELIKDSTSFALSGSNVKCSYFIDNDLWLVDIDEAQICQVFHNLVINADQAMPEGGNIEIRAENVTLDSKNIPLLRKGRYVKITIQDQGIGIAKEHLSKIFDPYFTTKQKGSGLGLTTSYVIIKKHAGHIEVESELGAGATFRIYLAASPEKIVKGKKKETELPAFKGKILFMDDEEMVLKTAGKILKYLGHEVEFASDGAKAIELYKKAKENNRKFNAVIMDLTVPGGMGGKEAIKKLLEIDPEAKAIVSSGYSEDPVLANFKKYGFKGLVYKPYKVKELGETLSKVLSKKN